jgi:hypothetical protein
LAAQHDKFESASALLVALENLPRDSAKEVEGQTVEEWLEWARTTVAGLNPLKSGIEKVFAKISGVSPYGYS